MKMSCTKNLRHKIEDTVFFENLKLGIVGNILNIEYKNLYVIKKYLHKFNY